MLLGAAVDHVVPTLTAVMPTRNCVRHLPLPHHNSRMADRSQAHSFSAASGGRGISHRLPPARASASGTLEALSRLSGEPFRRRCSDESTGRHKRACEENTRPAMRVIRVVTPGASARASSSQIHRPTVPKRGSPAPRPVDRRPGRKGAQPARTVERITNYKSVCVEC